MTVKELFDKAENGTLTWEQFQTAAGTAKFVDLTEGNYVSKQKFDDEISQRESHITELANKISARDTDLQQLQQKLTDAGDLDALKQASADLANLQKQYDKETKQYKAQLTKQAYEFAVKEFANSKNFTSNAAKRDFIQSMLNKNLSVEDGKIIGAEDFVQMYAKDNDDAFVKKTESKPQFTQSTEPKKQKKLSLTEMMKLKNDNPEAILDF